MYFVNRIRTEHLILKKPKQIKKYIYNTIKEKILKKKFRRDIGRIN